MQDDDERRGAELRRFMAQIKFVLESLPPHERQIAETVYHLTPMGLEDSPFIRMRRLIETAPEDRHSLIAAWEDELTQGRLRQ